MVKNNDCQNAKLRYEGCQCVLKMTTAQEFYSNGDGTYIIFDYLTKDFAFIQSKLDIKKLRPWETKTLKNLDHKVPKYP